MMPDMNAPLKSPLDLFKTVCFVCGQDFWPWQEHDCKASPQERAAFDYVTRRRREMREAQKRGQHTSSHVGLTTKPCPRCKGETGHWNCPLCDGCGQVPENML